MSEDALPYGVPGIVPVRGVDVPPFYAGRIARQAGDLIRAGRSVIPMHFGQPTAGTPPSALAAVKRVLETDPTGYFESRELIARIAHHYRDAYGLEVAPERILLTAGASAALVAVFAALFNAGDRIGLCRPGYPAYRNALRALGRAAVEIECGPEVQFRLDAARLASHAPLHGLVVASPANPTGAMLDAAQLGSLIAECRRCGTRLISDEIYHGISYGGRAVSALELDDEAIVINSFSKLFRMPGWRLGWLVAPPALAARLSAYVVNFFLTPPTLSQHAALAAFDDMAELGRTVESYARNRARLLAGLAACGLERISPPEGAFYLYADVGHLTDDSLSFCQRLLADTGVALAPGIDFDPNAGRHFIRLSFAVGERDIESALALLGPWLQAQPRLRGSDSVGAAPRGGA